MKAKKVPPLPPQRRDDFAVAAQSGYAALPGELLGKVLQCLLARWRAGGLGFYRATATMRLVCKGWRAGHDAVVRRLVLRLEASDEAVGRLVRRFPALVSLAFKHGEGRGVVTDESLRAVSSLSSLTSLDLEGCELVTSEGLGAVSSLPALVSLNLTYCKVTIKGLHAVSHLSQLTSLNLSKCAKVTDEGLRAVALNLTALASLNLMGVNQTGSKVTEAGLQALRSAIPELRIAAGNIGSDASQDGSDSDMGFTSDSYSSGSDSDHSEDFEGMSKYLIKKMRGE